MASSQEDKCLEELSSDDPYIRYAAVKQIGLLARYLGPQQTLEKLIPAIQSFKLLPICSFISLCC